ncbi:hypothetical protein RM697_03315 [Ichthyenterobacterium sp. W332]|uniref:Lipocalin-like domain-containing protein n=1 Tax=Microcosmobacter mediterraneus TaxID=3075607 RepID=A0ABU2YHM9_9FLAO|nr:hypothetical protein [Ichthyenterobacterium sp. W332]MDT0557658.1 hypothetical protein [Ichthyenterobacterium sp. W332]
MKKINLYVLILVSILISCSDDDVTINPLSNSGLLGEWEISSRGINNVSSLEALCCETIMFMEDSNINDTKGNYTFDDSNGIITNGVFTIDVNNNILLYTTENNNSYTQEYSLNSDVLEVWYFEEGDRYWTQYFKL